MVFFKYPLLTLFFMLHMSSRNIKKYNLYFRMKTKMWNASDLKEWTRKENSRTNVACFSASNLEKWREIKNTCVLSKIGREERQKLIKIVSFSFSYRRTSYIGQLRSWHDLWAWIWQLDVAGIGESKKKKKYKIFFVLYLTFFPLNSSPIFCTVWL